MTPAASNAARGVLRPLTALGARITVEGGRLHIRGATVPPHLLDTLRAHRGAVLEYLAAPPTYGCGRCGRYAFAEAGVTCYWCRPARPSTACHHDHER